MFLSTSLVIHDFQFVTLFLALSGLAAIICNTNSKINEKMGIVLPGLVALICFVIQTIFSSLGGGIWVNGYGYGDYSMRSTNTSQILGQESLLCLVSFSWSFWKYLRTNDIQD